MKIIKLNCVACGAPISIPEDLDFINCASCGTFLGIERGEGYVVLKVAEKLAKAIETSGKDTQEAIRESIQVTRAELQRLQLTHDLATAQMQLSNIQSEIRSVQRMPPTAITTNQLLNLRVLEYQAMDRIRILEGQLAALDPNNISAQIQSFEKEINFIDVELQVLYQIPRAHRMTAETSLKTRRKELADKVLQLKAGEIRKRLKSYQITEIPSGDVAQIDQLLALLVADEKVVLSLPYSPERELVYVELSKRYQAVKQERVSIERERVQMLLQSRKSTYDENSLISVQEYLGQVEADLSMLANEPVNEVVMETIEKLRGEKKKAYKLIRRLERNQSKATGYILKEQTPQGPGLWEMIVLAGAAFIGGISALWRDLFPQGSGSQQVTSPTTGSASTTIVTQDLVPAEREQNKDTQEPKVTSWDNQNRVIGSQAIGAAIQAEVMPIMEMNVQAGTHLAKVSTAVNLDTAGELVESKTSPPRFSFKSLLIGCVSWLLLTAGFFIGGLLFVALLFPNSMDSSGARLDFGGFLGITAIGYSLGARAFIRSVAPAMRIRGVVGKGDFVFGNPQAETTGLRNQAAVKALAGIITLPLVIVLGFALTMTFDNVWCFILGLILSPVVAGLVSARTYVYGQCGGG